MKENLRKMMQLVVFIVMMYASSFLIELIHRYFCVALQPTNPLSFNTYHHILVLEQDILVYMRNN